MSLSSSGALMAARRCTAWCALTRTASAHQVVPMLARPERRRRISALPRSFDIPCPC
eukprot:COSAG02_NODE_275_length_26232_cov_85.210424_8_plen_57_part_00